MPTARPAVLGPHGHCCPWEAWEGVLITVPADGVCMGLCALCLHTKYQGDNGKHTLPKKAASVQTKSGLSIPDKVAGVEGLALISSQKNTKITNNCLKTVGKKDWNLPKKILYIQRQGLNMMVGGVL